MKIRGLEGKEETLLIRIVLTVLVLCLLRAHEIPSDWQTCAQDSGYFESLMGNINNNILFRAKLAPRVLIFNVIYSSKLSLNLKRRRSITVKEVMQRMREPSLR